MEDVSLINHSVRAETFGTGMLEFMYPSFMVKSEVFFDYKNDVIYIGKNQRDLKGMLSHATHSFISTVDAQPDFDMDDRDTQMRVLYGKWGKSPSEKVIEVLRNLTEEDFLEYFKRYWVVGSSKMDKDIGVTIYDLYKTLGKSKHETMKTYFKLKTVYEDKYILSCVLSFIEKAYCPEKVTSSSGIYLNMLKEFSKADRKNMQNLLTFIYKIKNDESASYRTMWFLSQLGKGEIL